MTLSITLPIEIELALREQAASDGKDLAALVLEAVTEKVACDRAEAGENGRPSGGQRIAELRSWVAGHRRLSYDADDSRESIYEGRGE